MPQQINLHIPVLLAPRQRFSARAVGLALLALAALLTLVSAGVAWSARRTATEDEATRARQAGERAQLQQALAQARQRLDPTALARERQGLALELDRLRQQLDLQEQGRLAPGESHASALALIARTVPAGTWVTELRLGTHEITVDGVALDPAQLRAWVARLGEDPMFRRGAPMQLRVEQLGQPHQALSAATGTDALHPGPLPPGPAWAFRLQGERATPGEGRQP